MSYWPVYLFCLRNYPLVRLWRMPSRLANASPNGCAWAAGRDHQKPEIFSSWILLTTFTACARSEKNFRPISPEKVIRLIFFFFSSFFFSFLFFPCGDLASVSRRHYITMPTNINKVPMRTKKMFSIILIKLFHDAKENYFFTSISTNLSEIYVRSCMYVSSI